MEKMLLLVNPFAGQKKAARFLAEIIAIFNRADYDVLTYITAGPGDGEKAIARHAQDISLVVCCGGDGTFNETISGVLKSGVDIPIGYIPAGSTNDFASSLHLSSDMLEAARDIVSGTDVRLDVGCFAGRYFSYVASFGVFTRTSYATPQELKNIFGHAAYVLSGIQELSQLKPNTLCFTLPDGTKVEEDFIFGAISNSTSVGGVLTLSEDMVDLQDGKFELLLIRTPLDLAELAECIQSLLLQSYDSDMISFFKTDSVHIDAPADMDWTIDGEREPAHEQIEASCLKQAISLRCRRDSALLSNN